MTNVLPFWDWSVKGFGNKAVLAFARSDVVNADSDIEIAIGSQPSL